MDYTIVATTKERLNKIDELEGIYQKTISELYTKPESQREAKDFVSEIMNFLRSFREEYFTDFEERQILAQGEIVSVEMMRLHLKERGITAIKLSALDYMVTNKYGEPDLKEIKIKLFNLLSHHPNRTIYLTEGYICQNVYMEIDNLKRSGSDYTASLVGAALDAKEIQIWTDIDGLHNNDPRIVEDTTKLYANFTLMKQAN